MKLSIEDKDILCRDYASGEVDRVEAGRYRRIHRGSVRLVMDLFRTEQEQRQFIDETLRMRLPGQR